MAGRKGFSLIELIVILIIMGIIVAIALPNLWVYIEQSKAAAAKNNLLAIIAAQSKYYEDHGSYYTGINPIVDLSLETATSDPFSYSCAVAGSPYTCTASDGTINLSTNGTGVSCTPPLDPSCPN